MTHFGDDAGADASGRAPERGRRTRVATWSVVAALALISVNIVIAAVGGGTKARPAPTPVPVVTARPTGPAPTTAPPSVVSSATLSSTPSVEPAPAPLASSGVPGYLPLALAAITGRGDIALVDPESGAVLATLVIHESGAPSANLSVDGPGRLVYFDRVAACPAVWTYSLETGLVTRLVDGRHPVVSQDGKRLAVVGTGCKPGGNQAAGLAIYDAKTRAPQLWAPLGDYPTTAGHGQPAAIVDLDWLPDGSGVAVTVSAGERAEHHVVATSVPFRGDIRTAPRLSIDTKLPGNYLELAYAHSAEDTVLFMSGTNTASAAKKSLRTEWAEVFEGTPDGPVSSLTTSALGELLYVAGDGRRPGQLCGWGRGCRGGNFLRVDW